MGSKSIRMTFKCLDKIGKKNQIIPLDYRPYFLTRRGQNDLYGSGWKSYKTHKKKLIIDASIIMNFWN